MALFSHALQNSGKISSGTSACLGAQAGFAERAAFQETFQTAHAVSSMHWFCSVLHHLELLFSL